MRQTKRLSITCDHCAAIFIRRPSELSPTRNYCSKECYYASKGETWLDLTCSLCANTYRKPRSERTRKTDKNYCSWECYTLDPEKPKPAKGRTVSQETRDKVSKANKAAYKRKPKLKAERETKLCQHCNKVFTLRQGKEAKSQKFCSAECWYDLVREDPSLNGRYIDGTTTTLRGRTLWKTRRRQALERDSFTCQRCGNTHPIRLHVHHIIPCRVFSDSEVNQAHDLSNLTTLCVHCHMTVESEIRSSFASSL